MNLIEVKNLSFSYSGEHKILNNINMKVEEGEFLCIVGENGSGKSTLMKCILGLNKVENEKIPFEGTIRYLIGYIPLIVMRCFGRKKTEAANIRNKNEKIKVLGRIGYLPQITEIQNNFPATIEEIVLSGTIPDHKLKIFYTKEDKQKAKEVMQQLDLYEKRKKSFNELSGGQRQRVLIARALCSTEKILLLDEPVNGLDPKIVNQIYKLLYKLNKEKNVTIIMVSHDIDRALKYSTRVIEVAGGKIVKNVPADKYVEGGTD